MHNRLEMLKLQQELEKENKYFEATKREIIRQNRMIIVFGNVSLCSESSVCATFVTLQVNQELLLLLN